MVHSPHTLYSYRLGITSGQLTRKLHVVGNYNLIAVSSKLWADNNIAATCFLHIVEETGSHNMEETGVATNCQVCLSSRT